MYLSKKLKMTRPLSSLLINVIYALFSNGYDANVYRKSMKELTLFN